MTCHSRPHDVQQASNVPWFGDAPTHWIVCAIKHKYHVQLGKMLQGSAKTQSDREVPYLKAANVQWFSVETASFSSMWASPKEIAQFGIRKGDLLVCEGGEGGRSGIVKVDLNEHIIQNALHRVRPTGDNSNTYLQYVLFVAKIYGWLDVLNSKATIAHFTREKLAAFRVPMPPQREQRAIARYLDHMDQRVRRYVRAKERLIGLVEEEKQAIINQAVTRGLDPSVRLKASGVEWLGDVPEHWEVRRLKQVSQVQSGVTLGKSYGDKDLIERPYLRVANVQSGRLDLAKITTIRVPASEIERSTLRVGDVLMTEGGDIDKLGRGCVWSGEIPDCLHQNHVFSVRVNREVLFPKFLEALMGSFYGRCYFQTTAKQTTNLAATNQTKIGNFPLALPSVSEQRTILGFIRRQCELRDAAITRSKRQVSLLTEYRTRLIADVVTGKLDVREAAAGLGEEEGVSGEK